MIFNGGSLGLCSVQTSIFGEQVGLFKATSRPGFAEDKTAKIKKKKKKWAYMMQETEMSFSSFQSESDLNRRY